MITYEVSMKKGSQTFPGWHYRKFLDNEEISLNTLSVNIANHKYLLQLHYCFHTNLLHF